MDKQTKKIYEKMVDFRQFAVVLLAVGVFFFLGVIIPSDTKSEMDVNIMMIASMSFLAVSILLFIQSKQCQIKLMDMEDGNQR
ncbi:putative MFS family arabinose efflux permease [Bacillus niacini]|uniref:MFS family arabinose efflux permease n=1 Tax=Neobacillus niacini TaxID=86668 RepID=A0A852TBJ9_9BACI|nr:YrhC family protein [Neobacillus niacini]MDQ0975756.1 putative MFS family arabinose efflux permease [Neobacillus niacini]NYE05127.1 putative MFS family arabinose efflux permease [Neobacillus niacini]